jgi:hypothetical protein
MTVTATPIFIQAPKVLGDVAISTANTNRDGSGTLGTVFSGSANGDKVEHIDITATGTTTAGVIRLYIYNGSTAFLSMRLRRVPRSRHFPTPSTAPFRRIACSFRAAIR